METLYKIIDRIIAEQKKARQNNDYLTLMVNAEALLEYIPELIKYSVDMESMYRKFEAKLANEKDENNKRLPSSYCETQAKALDSYADWQRAKQFIDLMYEMVNMSKKLAGSVNSEFNSQI